MTKTEFLMDYERLCNGFRHQSTPEQSSAWYKKIGHVQAQDWSNAVDTLLCAPRFPMLDPVLSACDQAQESRRKHAAQRERMEANRTFAGEIIYRKGDDHVEQDYNAFRMKLMVAAHKLGEGPQRYADFMAQGLAEWINVREHAQWAQQTPMGDCGKHSGPHTVLRCITDEMGYWLKQAAQQKREVVNG